MEEQNCNCVVEMRTFYVAIVAVDIEGAFDAVPTVINGTICEVASDDCDGHNCCFWCGYFPTMEELKLKKYFRDTYYKLSNSKCVSALINEKIRKVMYNVLLVDGPRKNQLLRVYANQTQNRYCEIELRTTSI